MIFSAHNEFSQKHMEPIVGALVVLPEAANSTRLLHLNKKGLSRMTNIMKTTAIAAALSIGTMAAADASFGFQTIVEEDSSITLDLVRTPTEGVVAIYDYSTGEFGELLGTSPLNAGANADVLVQLDVNTASTLAAVIYEGDLQDPTMASNWIELDISEDS